MHEVDQKTENMLRSVLAYAENRLRMNPVPLDKGTLGVDELYTRLDGVIRETPRPPDEVLGVYTSVIAPSVISAENSVLRVILSARCWPGPRKAASEISRRRRS
ncbi:MAG: hypothetical protein ACXWZ2_00875 [Mycobacterium sp.]